MKSSSYILPSILLIFAFGIETRTHAIEMNEYLIKTGDPLESCAFEIPTTLEIGASKVLNNSEKNFLLKHYRFAARMAGEFSVQYQQPLVRSSMPTRLVVLGNPAELAAATGYPEFDRLGHVVARIDLVQGRVYLSRLKASDLFMELGKWFFYEMDFKWGRDLKADKEHLAVINKFSSFCQTQKELALDSENSDRFMDLPAEQFSFTYPDLKPVWRYGSIGSMKTAQGLPKTLPSHLYLQGD